MKTILFKLFTVFITLLVMTGCSEDFLNEPAPTDKIPPAVIFNTRQGAEAFISGIMRKFRGQFSNVEEAGLNSIFYARSVKGNDLIQENLWFASDYTNNNRDAKNSRPKFTWNYCYYMINQANSLILGVEKSDLSESDKKELSAYGFALRGFFYHQLVMEFAPTYSAGLNFPAPPIYTTPTLVANPMSTVKDVYELIVSDLTKAVSGLTEKRLGKSYINKSVANGILAQVYQVMGNWEGAKKAANAAYGGNPASVLNAPSYRLGFDDYTNIEWIWGSAQTSDQSNYYWNAPAAQADHLTTSYSSMYINKDFVSLFSATDIRGYFQKKSASITNLDDYRYWITRKFKFSFAGDNAIIRTPEMILIEAEAKSRLGDDSGAHELLYTLQKNRDEMAVKSTNSGSTLLEEILVERRKELYAEIGVEWFDAKRLRKSIIRTGNHRVASPATSLTADDKRFFMQVPQSEIDVNPFIDDAVNKDR